MKHSVDEATCKIPTVHSLTFSYLRYKPQTRKLKHWKVSFLKLQTCSVIICYYIIYRYSVIINILNQKYIFVDINSVRIYRRNARSYHDIIFHKNICQLLVSNNNYYKHHKNDNYSVSNAVIEIELKEENHFLNIWWNPTPSR